MCAKAAENGEYLQDKLAKIAQSTPVISNVRGKGLLTAFDFPDKTMRDKFIELGIENNVMFLGCGNSTIRFRPALIIEKNNIDEGLHILKKIANKL